MSEYLDRKQVIDLYEKFQPSLAIHVYEFGEALRKLPVTQDSHGEWLPIKNRNGTVVALRCSTCGQSPKYAIESDFCHRCGSDNRPKIHGCCFASEECAKNPCADCGLKEGEQNGENE